ncbi:uncharacterized protein LOC103955439 [Pyrus x bretschneideri]|uniref:uncharacterized protein LOC103955439 n=1 Tax=Pyrus x bretschneideri TaxID=225117 RepID=UPI00202DECF6|nr:uncharacterized protein LOC103955439 [Pyrus x bretschneideri]
MEQYAYVLVKIQGCECADSFFVLIELIIYFKASNIDLFFVSILNLSVLIELIWFCRSEFLNDKINLQIQFRLRFFSERIKFKIQLRLHLQRENNILDGSCAYETFEGEKKQLIQHGIYNIDKYSFKQ